MATAAYKGCLSSTSARPDAHFGAAVASASHCVSSRALATMLMCRGCMQVDAFVQEVGEETFNRSFVGRGMRVDICIPPICAPLFMYSPANASFYAPLPRALHLMHVGGIGANRAAARDLDVAISYRVQVETQGVRGKV